MSLPKMAIVAKLTAQPGRRDELVEALGPMFGAVAGEEGTQTYVMHRAIEDADVVWFYEAYADEEAVGAHSTSQTMKDVGRALRDILASPPEIVRLEPIRAKAG